MSRTDHPRIPGSHRALTRAHRLDLDWPGEIGRPVMPATTEIAHGLAAEPPLAEWERVLLDTPHCEYDEDDLDLVTLDELPEFVSTDVSETAYGVYEHWIPYVSIEQARDIFCGGDFIVVHAR